MSNVQATFEIRVGMTSRQAVWCLLCVRSAVFLGLPDRFEGETGQKDKKGRAWTRGGWLRRRQETCDSVTTTKATNTTRGGEK